MSAEALSQVNSVTIRQPHRIFKFASFAELHQFETKIAPMVDEGISDYGAWEARTPLEDALLGRRHGLDIKGIVLHAMFRPFERLKVAEGDTWTDQTARAIERVGHDFIGFGVVCNTVGNDDDVHRYRSRVWYGPLTRTRSGLRAYDPTGKGLRRITKVHDRPQQRHNNTSERRNAIVTADARTRGRLGYYRTFKG